MFHRGPDRVRLEGAVVLAVPGAHCRRLDVTEAESWRTLRSRAHGDTDSQTGR